MSDAAARPTPGRSLAFVFVIALVVAATFGRSIGHAFVYWDDQETIARNDDVVRPTLAGVLRYWWTPRQELYIPVTYTLWGALAFVAEREHVGLDPRVYRAANLVLHASAAGLVFLILRRLVTSDLAALAGALLFAVHPVQVESVAWTSGAKDLLSGALSLAAILLYVRAMDAVGRAPLAPSPGTPGEGWGEGDVERRATPDEPNHLHPNLLPEYRGEGPEQRSIYLAATVVFVLAMLAKPAAVALPLVVAAIDVILFRRRPRDVLVPLGLWLVLAVPVVLVTKLVQPAVEVEPAPLWARPLVAGDALAFYGRQLLWPARLTIDYGRTPASVISSSTIWFAWLAPAAVLAAAWLGRRRFPEVAAGAAVFVAALLPVLGLVPFSFQKYSTVADHYLYLPMFGIALAIAGLLARWSWRAWAVPVAIVLVVLAVRSHVQVRHWRDTDALFAHALAANPRSLAAHNVLAYRADENGDAATAEVHYRAALETSPNDPAANFNLANLLRERGQIDQAIAHYRAAAPRAGATAARVATNLGIALVQAGRLDEAEESFAAAARLEPHRLAARDNLERVRALRARTQPSTTTTSPGVR